MTRDRPGVSVVGRERRAAEGLRLSVSDEVIVADSLNTGAERAEREWVLFLGSDCAPRPSLLDDYFSEPVTETCGAVTGAVVGDGLVARYAASRGRHPLAGLLVRRAAWAAVGGFCDGVVRGAEADLCRRVQDAGWAVERREGALVELRSPGGLPGLLRESARGAAGRAWLGRRFWDSPPRATHSVAPTRWADRLLFRALDALLAPAVAVGRLLANSPPSPRPRRGAHDLVELVDVFPELSETFIAEELRALGCAGRRPRVEARFRARRPNRGVGEVAAVHYAEDEGVARKLMDLGWLVARHPVRCMGDVRERRRWAREEAVQPLRQLASPARRLARAGEAHLHAHFAAGSALAAMRLGDLLARPYSVALHGYDIYQSPRNLRDKLERAAFAVTGCEYAARDLRALVGAEHRGRIHKVVVGVDPERFRRRRPRPDGRTVLAVGRLLEKKGFAHLIEAVALLQGEAAIEQVLIVGEGPLRGELEERIGALGLTGTVRLLGPREPDEVRELLEQADVFAMPCVIASDGDRDTMPVVVKEALAMEVPVVATDVVGLPEVVRSEWGRLVPPRDPEGLAAAIAELLELPAEARAQMGRAGREFVVRECDVRRETEKLAGLVTQARS